MLGHVPPRIRLDGRTTAIRPLSTADVDEYARRLPAAEIITVEAGHNVQEDVPVRLAALIAERVDDAR